jgi:hypothetical protein
MQQVCSLLRYSKDWSFQILKVFFFHLYRHLCRVLHIETRTLVASLSIRTRGGRAPWA